MTPTHTWIDGRIVAWADSTIHVATEAVLRGGSVFEGIRAYRSAAGGELLLFRLDDHLHRLFHTSVRFLQMPLAYGPAELAAGIGALLAVNDVVSDAHVRVVAYYDELHPGHELETPAGAFIIVREGLATSTGTMRVMLSPWRRLSDLSMPPRVKASANYLNSRIATTDAQRKGFDSVVMLNDRGQVSEGPAMNVFIVRAGVLVTPAVTEGILEGVTRATVLHIAREHGVDVEERAVDPTELLVADEVFFCGTAYEVVPIVEIDRYPVGDGTPGPLTTRIRERYFELARGVSPAPDGWVTPVRDLPAPVPTAVGR